MDRILNFTFDLIDTDRALALKSADGIMDIVLLLLIKIGLFHLLFLNGRLSSGGVLWVRASLSWELLDHLSTQTLCLFVRHFDNWWNLCIFNIKHTVVSLFRIMVRDKWIVLQKFWFGTILCQFLLKNINYLIDLWNFLLGLWNFRISFIKNVRTSTHFYFSNF